MPTGCKHRHGQEQSRGRRRLGPALGMDMPQQQLLKRDCNRLPKAATPRSAWLNRRLSFDSRHRLVTVGILGSVFFCSRAASATVRAWARHIGAARERENVYPCSGTANSTFAFLARGESVLSEIAMMGTPLPAASSTTLTTSFA